VGVSDFIKGGIMKIGDYERCLEKLKKDIPWVNSVYLYLWGEPLMHPKIGDFVKLSLNQTCKCGRNMPIVDEIVGRVEDTIIGIDGREMVRFHGIFIDIH
jgi:phenylacetate-CoA ligase